MIPHQGRAIDTINFRNVKESASVDIGRESGLVTPSGEAADPFEEFNSVTLHHSGEDQHHAMDDRR